MEQYKKFRKAHRTKADVVEGLVFIVVITALLGWGFGLEGTAADFLASVLKGAALGILGVGIVYIVKRIYTAKTGKDLEQEVEKKVAEETKYNKKIAERTKREEEEYDDEL